MRYKTKMDAYLAWYDRMVKFIADHYDCKITYPQNVTNIDDMVDGLALKFNRIDWNCCLTNFCVYQIFSSIDNICHTVYFKAIRDYIESMLISNIKK